jgi:hypothetical protein
MNIFRNRNFTQAMGEGNGSKNVHLRYSLEYHHNLPHMLCPKACNVYNWLKRALPQSHIGRKCFYLENIKFIMIFFCEGSIKVTHSKIKTLNFAMCQLGMYPQLISMDCK